MTMVNIEAILQKRFDVIVPPRCTLHQCVKGRATGTDERRRCIICAHYKLNLNSQRCMDCLSTEELDQFEVDVLYLESVRNFRKRDGGDSDGCLYQA